MTTRKRDIFDYIVRVFTFLPKVLRISISKKIIRGELKTDQGNLSHK